MTCNCIDIEIQSYDRQILLHPPNHMYKNNGYCIDLCISQEISFLWMKGIITTGCCCGHNKVYGYIGVKKEFITEMLELGYKQINNMDDHFYPKYDKLL